MKHFDVSVRGRGAVGQALALALARIGLRVALSGAPAPGGPDVRTYALGARSVALLQQLKVWSALLGATPPAATRVLDMQVAGDAGGAIEFSAWQQCVGELAWIVDAAALERELATALRFAPHVTLLDEAPPATLTALCDGKDSGEREALGIEVERFDYGQRAIAARLASDRPHQGIARQWFRSPDVLALLPFDLPGEPGGYGLVWSLPDARAADLLALDGAAFEQALNEASQGRVGRLALRSARAAWPLRLARATRWHGSGWVLLGDAAHVVHPLAGQGLNLGLADVDTLCAVIAECRRREAWRSLGDEKLLARYARQRAVPTWAMGRVTDGLLQLFAHQSGPVRELRNRGLSLVNHVPALKRWLTDRALRG
ncbi:FAD-dependent monooxygenase [Methylibium sp.]|uniref:FAD-dependent monooxygenase n=1 Tax=Methylibium sp. TaxID=2067992 RepID=UPI003D09D887